MTTATLPTEVSTPAPLRVTPVRRNILLLVALWAAVFVCALSTPPLLDDADATHAQAAQAMLHTGDWVTLHVDGIRYLEKPPLPYWIAACSMAVFGENSFAVHLPLALTVLALVLLAFRWGSRAWGDETGFRAALFTLTCAGLFLFTRVFIPDALLALLLACALYAMLRALDDANPRSTLAACTVWGSLALATLTKGLVSLVFFFGTAIAFLSLNRAWHTWRRLRPFSGVLLLLAIAAPWHVLAGLRNQGGAHGHGFFWFYFINEHVLRFLGRRIPRDYNKLPALLYWTLHIVWLFPWSFFLPLLGLQAFRAARSHPTLPQRVAASDFTTRTSLLLGLFSALVLLFFAVSTNQEYYTLPVYLPLLLLLAASLPRSARDQRDHTAAALLSGGFVSLTIVGAAVAITLACGLWSARHLPFNADIGSLLAHRGVGDYTLSMSHFFDLTGASFAALRLPATLALLAFATGPAVALVLWRRRRLDRALLAIAATSAVFLIAAHIALVRFAPMLSSQAMVPAIRAIEQHDPGAGVALYGDQAFGSSLPFYLRQRVLLVDGRSTSMLFGSTFPDAPPLFLTHQQLAATWGTGPRKLLFVPLERRDEVDRLLGPRAFIVQELSGKALLTDRPLALSATRPPAGAR